MSSKLPIKIVKNRSKVIDIYFTNKDGHPLDLTNMTQCKCRVAATTGAPVEITLTGTQIVLVGVAQLGHVQARFTAANVEAMGGTDLEIELSLSGDPDFNPFIDVIAGALNLVEGVAAAP